jgi:hypothetical protein
MFSDQLRVKLWRTLRFTYCNCVYCTNYFLASTVPSFNLVWQAAVLFLNDAGAALGGAVVGNAALNVAAGTVAGGLTGAALARSRQRNQQTQQRTAYHSSPYRSGR